MTIDRDNLRLTGTNPIYTPTSKSLAAVITPPDIDGACAGQVGIDWTPRTPGAAKEALAICGHCPLAEKRKCAQYAVDTQSEGVWGGVYIRSGVGGVDDYRRLAQLADTGHLPPATPIDELKKQARRTSTPPTKKSLRCKRGHKRTELNTGGRGNCLICEKESRQARRGAA